MPPLCKVPGCEHSKLSKSMQLISHHFPANDDIRREWIRAIKNDTVTEDIPYDKIRKFVVCELHFHLDDYIIDPKSVLAPHLFKQKRCLKKTAVPSLSLPTDLSVDSEAPTLHPILPQDLPSPRDTASTPTTVFEHNDGNNDPSVTEMEIYEEKACKKMCCVPGCDNDLLAMSLGVPFHKLPNDAILRSIWIRVIGNEYVTENMPINTLKKRYVCGKHFKPSDYIEDIKSKLAPHIYRYRPTLVKTAVPSIMMPEIDDVHIESNQPEDLVAGIDILTDTDIHNNLRRKDLKCEFCGKYFNHKKEIYEHQGLEVLFKCGHCPQSYEDLCRLNEHIQRKHNSNQVYKCNICLQIFIRATDIKAHVQEHSRITQAYTCGVCGLNLCSRHLLSEHIEKHWGVAATSSSEQTVVIEPHQCEQPKKRLVSLLHGNFKPDLKIQDTYSHICNTCHQIFPNHIELQNHTLIMHSLEDTYECFYCKQVFSQSHTLEIHMKVHIGQPLDMINGKTEDKYDGNVQNNNLMETSELSRHKSVSPDSSSISSHSIPNHLSIRDHICDVCGESFPSSIPLHVHRKVFHGERPHKCEVCDETFQLKISLDKHFDKKHTGKPYKCDVCLKLYRKLVAIEKHRKRHINALPLECYTCSLCFDKPDFMFRHVKAQH